MSSKTPRFDKALDGYFAKLQLDEESGQWRTCRLSSEKFYIRPEDINFYKKIRVPLPTLSPNERLRRRCAFINSYNLFKTASAFSGKPVISTYPPQTPYKIYEHQVWFGDSWDPLSFGREIDFSKDFMGQFSALQKEVPRPNLLTDTTNVNSGYTNNSVRLKNCYLTFDTLGGEDLYYFVCCIGSKDCVDCDSMWESETCYECLKGEKLYKCFFCELSSDCLDSCFLFDCKNCSDCFGGTNLRNKKYVFFNEQLTKEDYEKKIESINLGNYETLEEYKKKFLELKKSTIHPALHVKNIVNSLGEFLDNCKNCYSVYYFYESENSAYSMGALGSKDSYDVDGGTSRERCYEGISISTEKLFNVKFFTCVNESRDIEYSDLLRNCHDCFGCIGLSNKSFCILNKQYEEEEYWQTVDQIKFKMLERGEYGEFFPPSLATISYNISILISYRGFNNLEVAKKYGYRMEEVEKGSEFTGDVVPSEDLPLNIKDVEDSILDKVVLDKESGKKFRIVPYELSFYQKHNLPLPRHHPDTRRNRKLNFWTLKMEFYDRTCPKCGAKMQSYFKPNDPETVYCVDCYRKEVA